MKIFHIYLFLTFCPHLTDIMMSLKDLSDGNTGQVVEAIVVKEVKPVVIIIHDGKTLGVVLVAEDPDRKYTKGGQGLQVIKNEVLQNDPLVLRRDPLLKIDCAWKSSKYLTVREILLQIHNISRLQNL